MIVTFYFFCIEKNFDVRLIIRQLGWIWILTHETTDHDWNRKEDGFKLDVGEKEDKNIITKKDKNPMQMELNHGYFEFR